MTTTIAHSFADLKNLKINTAQPATKKATAPSAPPRKAPKKVSPPQQQSTERAQQQPAMPRSEKRNPQPQHAHREAQPAALQRPVYKPAEPPAETFGKLVTILDGVFDAHGLANMAALADYAMRCFAASTARRISDQSFERIMLSTLEGVIHEVAAIGGGYLVGTRCRRLIAMLAETPALDEDGNLVRIGTRRGESELVIVERPKEASSSRAVWEKYSEINEEKLGDLETAKVTKRDSLRIDRLRAIRRTIPDLGSALVVAAIMATGFTERGMPKLEVDRLPVAILNWCISTVKDLREVLSEDDEFLRGRSFLSFVEDEFAISHEEYDEISELVSRADPQPGTTAAIRAAMRADYAANKAAYDEAKAKWKRLQEAFDDIQQEAVSTVDNALAFLRHKAKEKEYFRVSAAARKGEAPREPAQPKALQPQARKEHSTSKVTPDQAVQVLVSQGTAVDVDISVPHFNGAALGMSEVERRKVLKTAGLDGARQCAAYPGVIWEAVMGPLDHAMDLERSERDCRMVVIAPRRVGGMGLDLAESRALLVEEYESFFAPVEE